MTRSGLFDRLITIEYPAVTKDATEGSAVTTWVALSVLPGSPAVAEQFHAEVQDVMPSRDERTLQGLAIEVRRTRIRMRWRDDVTSAMRVTVHGDSNRIYQIIGGPAEIAGRKEMIEILCQQVVT